MHLTFDPQNKKDKKTILCFERDAKVCQIIQAGDIAGIDMAVQMAGVLHADVVTLLVQPQRVKEMVEKGWDQSDLILMFKVPTHGT